MYCRWLKLKSIRVCTFSAIIVQMVRRHYFVLIPVKYKQYWADQNCAHRHSGKIGNEKDSLVVSKDQIKVPPSYGWATKQCWCQLWTSFLNLDRSNSPSHSLFFKSCLFKVFWDPIITEIYHAREPIKQNITKPPCCVLHPQCPPYVKAIV